jgi:acyl transferase domain-containing protein/acyl carrier protein
MTSTNAGPHSSDSDSPSVEPIAIIGLACRLPGARDVAEFWRNLVDGTESVRFTSLEEQAARGIPQHEVADPNFVPAAAILDDYEYFDAAFFGMSAREAELRDPQHRLFLELAHTALEDSGYDPFRYPGEIGVYAGVGDNGYEWHNIRRNSKVASSAGNLAVTVSTHTGYLATFAAYKLNLRGPSLTVHTACSTSLVSLHLACEALRNGECDMAITGGVCLDFPVGRGYVYIEDGVNSQDGHVRTFDADATGTVWGNGGGVLVVKRLSDAIADRDHIHAVVLGNAINNDGATKVGFTAPSQEGQAAVIAQALGVADVDARTVSYVEAHGTGTLLGDPIEVAALTSAYRAYSGDTGWCALGTVKTNVGHLGPAAGITSVIKTTLCFENGLLPPVLHFQKPNPKIDFAGSPFYVNATLSAWKANGRPRRAGVSSFGMGGTNAHLVMEEAPPAEPVRREPRPAHLLQLSARTDTALTAAAQRLSAHLSQPRESADPEPDLADVAYTLRVGRREFGRRLAVVASDPADAAAALADPRRRITSAAPSAAPRVALMFSGQGAQYAGMGAQLYRMEPAFRDAVDECAEILANHISTDIRGLMFATGSKETEEELRRTAITQPALFTIGYALARLWQSWGVDPAATIGHSIGEYVAATLAGVFTLPDAVRVVAARGALMQKLPAGAMVAVQLDEKQTMTRLPAGLSIATVNGPGTCVVSGPEALVAEFAVSLKRDGVGSRPLRTSHAFHSAMMEPALAPFRAVVAEAELHAPRKPFLSNVTGRWITAAEATDPTYWARHVRETVRFGDGLTTLLAEGDWLLVECGPGRQLCGAVALQRSASIAAAMPSLPHRGDKRSDLETLYTAAGRLWTSGARLDLDSISPSGFRVPLPTYPWERKYYWIKPEAGSFYPEMAQTADGPRPLDAWFAIPAWRQLPPVAARRPLGRCLVFTDPAAGPLAAALTSAGADVTLVRPGEAFGRDADGSYTMRPAAREDYDALIDGMAADGGVPPHIVHAWTLGGAPASDPESAWQAQDAGFFSLLWLCQALAAAAPGRPVHVDVITAGTHDVTGSDLTRPEHATVAGIVKVIPLEIRSLSVRHVDLDPGDGWPAGNPLAIGRLVSELRAEPAAGEDTTVALRGGRRWQRRYEPVTIPGDLGGLAAGGGLREGGVYLITGGLGGIGITVAEDLARQVRARLILLSRSGLPPREEWDTYIAVHGAAERTGRAIEAIRRIEHMGGEVMIVSADVTSTDEIRKVREQALRRFGRIDAIVHAAGVPGGGMAEVKDRRAAEAVMRPKVAGTLALRQALGDLDLDFVLLCSSVYAVSGGFGQVDYCAANNFLDAYARGAQWNTQVISVNWGGWLEVGMAAEVAAPAGFRALQRGDKTRALDHPILTRSYDGDEDLPGWSGGVISPGTHWVLAEHRIAGVPVLPGTGLIETARRAFESAFPQPSAEHVVELRDVAFIEPLSVPDGTSAELRIVFGSGTDGLDFQAVSVAGGRQRTHAQGSAAWVIPPEEGPPALDAIRARCTLATRGADAASEPAGLVTFGPHWGNLRYVHEGQYEELALIEATEETAADLARWTVHPALLDEATAFGRPSGEGRYLPLGYGRIIVRRPLPARFWSHLRHGDSGTAEVSTVDLSLLDDMGQEIVSITDFTMRQVDVGAVTATLNAPAPVSHADAAGAAGRGETLTGGPAALGIRPEDGAAAFRRLISTDIGPQAVVSVLPIDEIIAATREFTQDTIEEELDANASTARPEQVALDGYAAPRNELQAAIARIWGEALGINRVGVNDEFFEVGGNSLIAVQLIAQVRKDLGVRLPMRSIFENPTVGGIAALIERIRGAAQPDGQPASLPAPLTPVPRRTATNQPNATPGVQ